MSEISKGLVRPFASKTVLGLASVVIILASSGCSYFSKTAQDKAACDKLSDIITNYSGSSNGSDADLLYALGYAESLTSFADRIDSEVRPLASMEFASAIDELVSYLRKAQSKSIFDVGASFSYGMSTLGEVTGHCILVSKEN
jgi:hypothetical protein